MMVNKMFKARFDGKEILGFVSRTLNLFPVLMVQP